jgi:hypothetical protein
VKWWRALLICSLKPRKGMNENVSQLSSGERAGDKSRRVWRAYSAGGEALVGTLTPVGSVLCCSIVFGAPGATGVATALGATCGWPGARVGAGGWVA